MNTTKIPDDELLLNLKILVEDIQLCMLSLKRGIQYYSGGSVQQRLLNNISIAVKILNELRMRAEKE